MKTTTTALFVTAAVVASAMLAANRAGAAPIAIFPTGVDSLGNQLPGGAPDLHYSAQNNGGPINPAAALSRSNYWPTWPAPNSGGEWINYIDSSQTFGTTDFYTTFDLTGLDPSTAKLSLTWTSDNGSTVFLNGNPVLTRGTNDFSSLFSDMITSGFQPGINTLDFRVAMDSFDGLIVNSISGTATPVPEPATAALAVIGLAAVGMVRRKHRDARGV